MADTLLEGMNALVNRLGMLSSLCVCYGTANQSNMLRVGLAQEVVHTGGQYISAPKPLHPDSLFDLASLTKLFTAIAVLQLVERGRLDFGNFVGAVDSRFSALGDTTLYDVLTYQAVLRSPRRIDAQPNQREALRQVFSTYRLSGPEPEKLYSDMNALVLKYVVERVTGKGFYDFLQDSILRPCGMNSTYATVPLDRLNDCLNYNYEHRLTAGQGRVLDQVPPGVPHDPKARMLRADDNDLSGHAGLFSTAGDMVRLVQGLLRGELLSQDTLMTMGQNRTGRPGPPYRQYLGYLVFSKSIRQSLSEVPEWMSEHAFGISGYTGNHIAIDPQQGVFDIFLGNRCHNRVTVIDPQEEALRLGLSPEGAGAVAWPDGRQVRSSFHYYRQKDKLLHSGVAHELKRRGWLTA